jgi:hypothetical protein
MPIPTKSTGAASRPTCTVGRLAAVLDRLDSLTLQSDGTWS